MNVSASDDFRGQDTGYGKIAEKVSGVLEAPLDLTAVNKRGRCWSFNNCPEQKKKKKDTDV